MERVHIGQKLILEDLIDSAWQQKYAEPSLLASMLKECGIAFVEFGLSQKTDDKAVVNMAEVFAETGLFVSLDLQYEWLLSNELSVSDNLDFKRKLDMAQIVGNITRVPVPCIFRSGMENQNENNITKKEMLSRDFFSLIDRVVSEEYGNVAALCKTWPQGSESCKKSENFWQSYLPMIQETNLGLCWDLGDTFMSLTLGESNRWPADNFLARVNHVQAYDTVISKQAVIDRLPLADGMVPWREYCSLLARYDYDSTVVLDVDPGYYDGIGAFLVGVTDGLKKLRAFFG